MRQSLFYLGSVAAAMLLSGCASMPADDEVIKDNDYYANPMIEEWKAKEPAIKFFKVDGGLVIAEPNGIPTAIKNIDISTGLSPESTVTDLAVMLDQLGVYAVIPEKEVRDMPIALFAFEGKLGDYLDAVSSAYNVSFNWKRGNVLTIEKASDYILRIPQDEDLATAIQTSLEKLGASNVHFSLESGSILYSAPLSSHERIVDYVERLSINAAMISIQASVVTVALDNNLNRGFDWSSLNATIGNASAFESSESTTSTTDTSTTDTDSDDTSTSGSSVGSFLSSSLSETKALMSLTNGGGSLSLLKGDLNFTAAINFLNTYGNTETKQSVLMKTLSGKEVGIKSINEVPYIDNVGTASSQSGYTNGTGFGTTNVETLEIGLDLTLKPYYSSDSEIVTIDIQLELSSLLGMMELQAGNQLGTISYPNTQKQSFKDIVKLRAGEPVIVGGITYNQIADSRSNLAFLKDYETASQNLVISRNAMFILLRPTITVFGDFDQDQVIVVKE